MKNISLLLILGVVVLFANNANATQKLQGNGNVKKEVREITAFDAIVINGVFEVFLSQGSDEELALEADENLLEYIVTRVKNNELIIELKPNTTLKNSKKMNVYITLKSISKLVHNGVGNVQCATALKLNTIKLHNSGVGNITLKGTASDLSGGNFGVGNVDLHEFEVENCDFSNSGVGNLTLNVKNNLKISNSGVGDVIYLGDPKMVDIDSNGVGKVRKK